MPEPIGSLISGYRIESVLGSGGMGTVYAARHPRVPRVDALKVLAAEYSDDPEFQRRFEREADIAADLDHPHILQVFDRGADRGRLWMSMKLIRGTDADAMLVDSPHGLPTAVAVSIVSAVADALDFAHARGLLHRDVKPANILIDETRKLVLLSDFGIARPLGRSRLTATGMVLGTVDYCSPEQLAGGDIDGRSDQYSLACTAFTLLTGAPPFDSSSTAGVIGQHMVSVPPPLSRFRRDTPAAADVVIGRAMAKAPEARYRTCAAFATALAEALDDPSTVKFVPGTSLPDRTTSRLEAETSPPDEPTAPTSPHPGLPRPGTPVSRRLPAPGPGTPPGNPAADARRPRTPPASQAQPTMLGPDQRTTKTPSGAHPPRHRTAGAMTPPAPPRHPTPQQFPTQRRQTPAPAPTGRHASGAAAPRTPAPPTRSGSGDHAGPAPHTPAARPAPGRRSTRRRGLVAGIGVLVVALVVAGVFVYLEKRKTNDAAPPGTSSVSTTSGATSGTGTPTSPTGTKPSGTLINGTIVVDGVMDPCRIPDSTLARAGVGPLTTAEVGCVAQLRNHTVSFVVHRSGTDGAAEAAKRRSSPDRTPLPGRQGWRLYKTETRCYVGYDGPGEDGLLEISIEPREGTTGGVCDDLSSIAYEVDTVLPH